MSLSSEIEKIIEMSRQDISKTAQTNENMFSFEEKHTNMSNKTGSISHAMKEASLKMAGQRSLSVDSVLNFVQELKI